MSWPERWIVASMYSWLLHRSRELWITQGMVRFITLLDFSETNYLRVWMGLAVTIFRVFTLWGSNRKIMLQLLAGALLTVACDIILVTHYLQKLGSLGVWDTSIRNFFLIRIFIFRCYYMGTYGGLLCLARDLQQPSCLQCNDLDDTGICLRLDHTKPYGNHNWNYRWYLMHMPLY